MLVSLGFQSYAKIYQHYDVSLTFCSLKMDLGEKNEEKSIAELSKKIPVLSEYVKSLDSHVKLRYLKKLSVIGVDPQSIPSERFSADVLPPIEATDLVSYLLLETSYYTKEQFKAYKSLEAFNQMVSGFITSVRGLLISGKVVVVGKVRHSQRMNDPLISIWIITEEDGTILSAHCCGCKAGLSESCSHVASVLFYIEAWTRIYGKLACTQVKCTWLLPTFVSEVTYDTVRNINFASAGKLKEQLDNNLRFERSTQATKPTPQPTTPTSDEMTNFFKWLNNCKVKAVSLSLVQPYADQFVSKSRAIPAITDLYDPKNLELDYAQIINKCKQVEIKLSDEQITQIEQDTKRQAKSSGFHRHRAGRIGASISGAVCHSDPTQPSQSLIKTICYPSIFKATSKAIKHGCKEEKML